MRQGTIHGWYFFEGNSNICSQFERCTVVPESFKNSWRSQQKGGTLVQHERQTSCKQPSRLCPAPGILLSKASIQLMLAVLPPYHLQNAHSGLGNQSPPQNMRSEATHSPGLSRQLSDMLMIIRQAPKLRLRTLHLLHFSPMSFQLVL